MTLINRGEMAMPGRIERFRQVRHVGTEAGRDPASLRSSVLQFRNIPEKLQRFGIGQ